MAQKPVPAKDELLARAVERFRDDEFFVAWALERFRLAHGLTGEQLASFLDCSPDRLIRLALCRRPLTGSPRYEEDVRLVAAYAGVDPGRLAILLETVERMRREEQRSSDGAGFRPVR